MVTVVGHPVLAQPRKEPFGMSPPKPRELKKRDEKKKKEKKKRAGHDDPPISYTVFEQAPNSLAFPAAFCLLPATYLPYTTHLT
jgi:hypothetical protein